MSYLLPKTERVEHARPYREWWEILTYNLLAYGGTGLGYGRSLGYTFTADTNNTASVVAQDDDPILNDWTYGNYKGTATPGITEGDKTSTVISSEIPWLTAGDLITSGNWYELAYTESNTGATKTVDAFLIWNDASNIWGGYENSYVFTTAPLIDGVTYLVKEVYVNAGVPWDVLICFARGTQIRTPYGETAVEDLCVGDDVVTLDNGIQKIRWVGRRRVAAVGKYAPIEFRAGTLGNKRNLCVSPNHRIMVSCAHAELMFGSSEVLVAAKFLVNESSVRPKPGGEVEYYHLLFDRHEVIYAEGATCESFLPGAQSLNRMSEATRDEILKLFPELLHNIDAISMVRPPLKPHEGRLLQRYVC